MPSLWRLVSRNRQLASAASGTVGRSRRTVSVPPPDAARDVFTRSEPTVQGQHAQLDREATRTLARVWGFRSSVGTCGSVPGARSPRATRNWLESWITSGMEPLIRRGSPLNRVASCGGIARSAATNGGPRWGHAPPAMDALSAMAGVATRRARERYRPTGRCTRFTPRSRQSGTGHGMAAWTLPRSARCQSRRCGGDVVPAGTGGLLWCITARTTWLPTVWSQAARPDTEPRGLRPIAGSTLPRPDRRAAPDAQPGARPHATRRSVQPQGVVAVRYLRPRVEGHDRKSHVRGDRLSGLRASAPCQDAAQGGPGALARGQAAGDRCPAAPVSEPGNRCRPPRRAIGPEAVVAVRQMRNEGGPPSLDTHGRVGLPGVLSSSGRRRAVGKAVRFGNVDASLAGSLRIPARAEFAGAAAVRSIRRMRTTQEIVQSRDERLRELNDEIKMLDAARVALERREHRPSTLLHRPP